MQSPKSNPDIPFFICSTGFKLIVDDIIALKFTNSFIEFGYIKADMFEYIISLKSSIEVLFVFKTLV